MINNTVFREKNLSNHGKQSNDYLCFQGPRSPLKSEGAQGGYFFSCNFLLLFWAIWKNDLFSKSQKVGGSSPLCPSLYAAPDIMKR